MGPGPAQSDLYEYIDENGVRSYTDDSSVMSMSQRDSAKTHPEVVSMPQSGPDPAAASQGQFEKPVAKPMDYQRPLAKKPAPGEGAAPAVLAVEADALKQIKSDLDREYSRLQSEKQRLTNLRDELKVADGVSVETMENFRNQVNALNRETAYYEKQLMEFMTRVSKYNKKIQ